MMDDIDKTIAPQRFGGRREGNRFSPGESILGRYKVLAELGQGGMGVVYKCFDETAGIEVALKALPPELSHNSLEMEDIRHNFQLVEKLHHPNIAAYKNLERDSATGDYYLIMECVEGQELSRWFRAKRREGALALEEVQPIVRQIASALDYAHGLQIIHRDIKPGNVMIAADGAIKVLDFGLAAQIHTSMTRVSMAYHGTSGTGPYMAPEQWEGQAQDAAADQYALAVLAYELLAGHPPFESHDIAILREAVLKGTPRQIDRIPASAWNAVKRAMSKDRALRFASCSDFAAALGGAKVGGGGAGGFAWKKYAGIGVAVLLLAVGAAGFHQYREMQRRAEAERVELARQEQARREKAEAERQAQLRREELARNLADMKRFYKEKNYGQAFACAQKADPDSAEVQYYFGMMYDNGRGTAENDAEAVKWFRQSAENGDLDAQCQIGIMYESGRGVERDFTEAVKWYRKSAEQGDADAQKCLGVMYANGRGVAKDDAKAAEWYLKSAAQGNAVAQFNLGVMYDNGRGVAKDEVEAFKWFRRSAENGDDDAQCQVGIMYENGRGVERDLSEAVNWYRKSAGQGDADAQKCLGVMYANGRGVAKDEAKAAEWYRKSAEQGDADAQKCLGVMYAIGRGVARDEAKAAEWYRKSAAQGNVIAQYNLGVFYYNGRGVAKDEAEAVRWFRKAADQEDSDAQYNLGVCYDNGTGVAKDEAEAVNWYRKAAAQGQPSAQYNLAVSYAYGTGVAKNEDEAVKWYRKAAEQGNEKAIRALKGRGEITVSSMDQLDAVLKDCPDGTVLRFGEGKFGSGELLILKKSVTFRGVTTIGSVLNFRIFVNQGKLVKIENCTMIAPSGQDHVVSVREASSLEMKNCRLVGGGLWLENGTSATASGISIEAARGTSVTVGDRARLILTDSTIRDSANNSVTVFAGYAMLKNCKILDSKGNGDGLYLSSTGGAVWMDRCLISNQNHGIWPYQGIVKMNNTTIQNCRSYGIDADSRIEYFNCRFSGNKYPNQGNITECSSFIGTF